MNKRHLYSLRLFFINSPMKRANFLRKKNVFHSIGNRVMITSRKIPLYAKLISIGNNVWMASGVSFITHDVTHYMLNGLYPEKKYQEKIGCIRVGDNVFIGAETKILYDVNIGDNIIIAAGSIVTKDLEPNGVYGGIPARRLCSLEEYLEKRKDFHVDNAVGTHSEDISAACEQEMWNHFYRNRGMDH